MKVSQTTPTPYSVFLVTKAATDPSALEKLPEDVLVRICQLVGDPDLRKVCKQLNALHLKAAPLFVNMFKRVVSFPQILPIFDGYRLELSKSSKYEIAVRSYCRLMQEIRKYKPDYTLPQNLAYNPFSLEAIEQLSQDYRIAMDRSLVAFCFVALPANIREQLLDQSVIDLPLHDKAAALRKRISASKRDTLESLSLPFKNLSSIPPEISHFPCNRLELAYNPIRSLPDEIFQSQNLRHLDISNTLVHTLPTQIVQLKNLGSLNIESSQISSLPIELGQLRLGSYVMRNTPLATSLKMCLTQSNSSLETFLKSDEVPPQLQALVDLRKNSPYCLIMY